jgi:hypothetical protein
MKPPTLPRPKIRPDASPAGFVERSIREGLATIDQLLADINPNDRRLTDAALDLRLQIAAMADAEAGVAQLFVVAGLLGRRHYEAFFRLRCWATRVFRVEVRADRNAAWRPCTFPLNSGGMGEAAETAIAALLPACHRPTASVRFVFALKHDRAVGTGD